MPTRSPRRAPSFNYLGPYRYSLTLCAADRRPHFTDPAIVWCLHAQILRSSAVEWFAVLAYCYMPDHLHLLVEGVTQDALLPRFVVRFRQTTGHVFARRGIPLWQPGYFDHVLRKEEATEVVARYIWNNPVRAGLVEQPQQYAFSGGTLFGRYFARG